MSQLLFIATKKVVVKSILLTVRDLTEERKKASEEASAMLNKLFVRKIFI